MLRLILQLRKMPEYCLCGWGMWDTIHPKHVLCSDITYALFDDLLPCDDLDVNLLLLRHWRNHP